MVTDGVTSIAEKDDKGFVSFLRIYEFFPPFMNYHSFVHIETLGSSEIHVKFAPEISEFS